MSRRIACCMLVAALAAGGCAKHEERPASTLTEAQRDTAISRSVLPGAAVVGRALQVSGQEAGHSAAVDSMTR